MERQQHQQEIQDTRVGGFGSSDAKMVLDIAERIKAGLDLTTSQKHRILQMKGVEYRAGFSNAATDAGHVFEDETASHLEDNWIREHFMEDQSAWRYSNFRVFAHADFFDVVTDTVKELKWSRAFNCRELRKKYIAQLQWYYMLGAQAVTLHCDTEEGRCAMDIPKDDEIVKALRDALLLIDGRFQTLNLKITEVYAPGLPPVIYQALKQLAELHGQQAEIEEKKAAQQAIINDWMEANEITKIGSNDGTVVRVGAVARLDFDKKAFQREYPDLYAAFLTKPSKKAAFLRYSKAEPRTETTEK